MFTGHFPFIMVYIVSCTFKSICFFPASRQICALPPVPGDHGLAGDGVQPGGALRLLVDEEDAAAPGDPVSPGPGQGADPLQVQIRRHV